MLRATAVSRDTAHRASAGTVTLDHWERHRRRVALKTDEGMPFLLDLPQARVLDDGDALELEDGRLVIVRAMAEPLLEVRAAPGEQLSRLAWHIGNRHLPAEIGRDYIRIGADHVIAEMLVGLGASVRSITAPFRPEGGAYSGHGHGGHGHS